MGSPGSLRTRLCAICRCGTMSQGTEIGIGNLVAGSRALRKNRRFAQICRIVRIYRVGEYLRPCRPQPQTAANHPFLPAFLALFSPAEAALHGSAGADTLRRPSPGEPP